MTDIITKKITDLTATNQASAGDLFVIRKTGEAFDRKITKENLVESLGNPAEIGFSAVYSGENQVTLTAINGAPITSYKDSMIISFRVPEGAYNPNANFTIRIGDLDYKTIKEYYFDSSIKVGQYQYIEAIYNAQAGHFYHTNNSNDTNSSIEYNVAGTGNNILLTTISGFLKGSYYDNMTISFITKAVANANVTITVDNLAAKPLKNQLGQNITSLIAGQPILAVYNVAANAFIMNVQSNIILTNEYVVDSTEILTNPDRTIFNLTSAVGTPKHLTFGGYYEGMTAIFTAKFDDIVRIRSSGAVFVKIDEFADAKLLTDPDDDPIANDVLAGQTIIAKYDGQKFIKNRFAVEVDDGIPEVIDEPVLPPVEDPLDPNYQGDPRDPANTINENAVDDQGLRIFDIVLTVGSAGANFTTLPQAILKITRDYGNNGERLNGKKIALVILNNIGSIANAFIHSRNSDLRYITIFSQNNQPVIIHSNFLLDCNYSPILNFKLNFNNTNAFLMGYYTNGRSNVTFGKNAEISETGNYPLDVNSSIIDYCDSIIAPYGLKVNLTKRSIGQFKYCYINKLQFISTNNVNFQYVIQIYTGSSNVLTNPIIANSTFTFTNPSNLQTGTVILALQSNLTLRNVTITTRPINTAAIVTTNSNVKIITSTLAGINANTSDIKVDGQSRLNIIRKDAATTGTLNQPLGQETNLGTIILEG